MEIRGKMTGFDASREFAGSLSNNRLENNSLPLCRISALLACVGLGLCMDYGGRGVWDSPMVTTDTLTQNDAFLSISLLIYYMEVLQVSFSSSV